MRSLLWIGFFAALSACKKGPEAAAAVKVGWQEVQPGKSCYYAPNFEKLAGTDRKIARQQTLEAMVSQWGGGRNDGVTFDETVVENVETALLGTPTAIETVAAKNLAKCEVGDTATWGSWLARVPGELAVGQCSNPLTDRWFYYLDIKIGWQNRAPVCKGNVVEVKASSVDFYRLNDKGPWVNAEGDTSKSASATELPCNTPGCFPGQIVMRFVGESGATQVIPVGLSYVFTAPEHGSIEIAVNDDTFYDNQYKVESGLEHHTSIEYAPR